MSLVSSRQSLVNGLVVAIAAIFLYNGFSNLFGERAVTVSAQTDTFLSRRIDLVEQRFYSIESRLNRMEMETRQPALIPRQPDSRDTELAYLRSQIESLRSRIGEAECELLRLDERTLTAAQRRATAGNDPCRQNWGAPIRLSVRPGQ